MEEVLRRFAERYHPDLRLPPIPPDGWDRIAPLVSARLHFGVSRAAIAGAMGSTPQYVGQIERGSQRVGERFVARYRRALEGVIVALAESSGDAPPAEVEP